MYQAAVRAVCVQEDPRQAGGGRHGLRQHPHQARTQRSLLSLSLFFFATEAYNGGPVSPLLGFYFMSFVWQLQQILSFFEICMFSKCVKL